MQFRNCSDLSLFKSFSRSLEQFFDKVGHTEQFSTVRKWNWYGHWLLCIYSDVLRVAILYKFGGTYMDTDIITLSDHPSVRVIHKRRHFMFLTPSLSQWHRPYGLKNSSLNYWRGSRGPRGVKNLIFLRIKLSSFFSKIDPMWKKQQKTLKIEK